MSTRHWPWLRVAIPVAAIAVTAVTLAACGGHSSAAPNVPSTGSADVLVGANPHLGNILVDGKGRTLYLFLKDSADKSSCYGGCASLWPPLTTGAAPAATSGANAALVGTTTRTDGTKQVTYHGHPLYYYVVDKSAGALTGQGLNQFGGLWYALSPQGLAVTKAGA